MTYLTLIEPGMATGIQDLGRMGFQSQGYGNFIELTTLKQLNDYIYFKNKQMLKLTTCILE